MPRLKQTILILAAAAALLLPACSPSDDVTLPAPAAQCITVTTPPKPAFSGDGAQTRFNEETYSWEVGDVAEMILRIKKADDSEDQNGYTLTCVAVNTDGSAEWKIEDFSIDLKDIIKIQYSFGYSYSDSYGITTDLINSDGEIDISGSSIITDRGLNLPLTNMNHFYSRFRLTGLQKGDYVTIDNGNSRFPYRRTGNEAITNIRFIAADDKDTYIYMQTYSDTPVTITVARRGVTLSKTLEIDSENGKAYSIDISTFKAFDGENPQDVTWIHNATELLSFANAVNSGNDYTNKIVRLACDIDWEGMENFSIQWGSSSIFDGTFDGNGYSIKNFKIEDDRTISLFYNISSNGIVKNLTFNHIMATNSYNICGFASANYGVIDHCNVTGGTLDANNNDSKTAGFIRENGGTVTYCTTDVKVSGADKIAEFAFINFGKIERCGVTGTTTLTGNDVYGFVYENKYPNIYYSPYYYVISCYTDAKKADGSIPAFCNTANDAVIHCRSSITKENIGNYWGIDTGWYRTDTPEGVLKLYWEE